MDYLKKSRIEEVLIAILGKGTVTSKLISRIEKILDAIRVKGSYDGMAMSEVEEILVCIFLGKRFEKPTHSRIAAMLKVKANGGEYTELRKSRVEELIYEWLDEAKEAITYTGALPSTLTGTTDGYLASYKIYGNDGAENVNLVPFTMTGNDVWIPGGYMASNGTVNTSASDAKDCCYTDYIPISYETNRYYIFAFRNLSSYSNWSRCCIYDASKEFLRAYGGYLQSGELVMDLQQYADSAAYIRLSTYTADSLIFLPGDTVPAVVSPYGSNPDGVGVATANGYMLPMITSDGSTTTETDIYIGDTALEKGEYVDSAGKIYKRTENLWNNEFILGYHLDSTTGLPVSYPGSARMATLSPIDVVNVDTVSFNFKNLSETSFMVMYSLFDEEETLLQRVAGRSVPLSFSVANAAKLYISLYKSLEDIISASDVTDIMLVDGQSIPAQYIPYLAPTDPPAPLPQIPTYDGTTTVSYDGEPKPEKVELTYYVDS